MATATVIQSLTPHLNASQVRELPGLQQRFSDSRVLLKELHRRGWLTTYQAQQLSQGKGTELILGGYRILDRLGEGAAGQVFKALRVQQNLLVALKVLKKEVQADAEMAGRFRREIEAVSQVAHPNIVKAYEAGTADGQVYLAMEYVEGVDLARLVKESGPLPAATACDYIRQAALALQHIHERGLVHRDIKPANFLRTKPTDGTPWGSIKLLDLGLAKVLEPRSDSTTSNLTMLAGNTVTIGTPDYLAPEQAIDLRSADIRADIYSLGCTFYYLLTGQPPFGNGSFAEKLMRHHQADPPHVKPPELDDIIQRMLAKRPADRFQTPGEVGAALAALAKGKPVQRPARRWRRAAFIALPIMLLGAAGWFLGRPGESEPTTPTRTTAATPITPQADGGRTIAIQGRKWVSDALIDYRNPDISYGGVPRDNQLMKNGQSSAFLVRFGLENAGVPAGSRLEQAVLSFFVWDPHNNRIAKVSAFPLLTSWREDQATWNRPQAGQTWKGGASFALAQDAGPPLGHCVVQPDQGGDTAEPPIEYQIDVTPIARDWLRDPATNHGLAIVPIPDRAIDGGHASRFQIYAVEHNRAAYTPKLTLRVAE